MKPITGEWVAKAEGDFAVMQRETRVRTNPNYDAICFHAQHRAEKYIKAMLVDAGMAFAKIHNLVTLLDQVLPVVPAWEEFREDLALLTTFAVAFRYPGENIDRDGALDVARRCRKFRAAAKTALENRLT
jgi:HEPN domain-containing protein